jgi:hypothetical protein
VALEAAVGQPGFLHEIGHAYTFDTAQTPKPTDDHSASASASVGEHRQLTVMFCDLVGSTALSEKLDPEELRSLLHAYRTLCGDVIARYDGFVARHVGDRILTYFSWPMAHEEDAERAVRAALEIVQTVKRASSAEGLSVRIGIATGPVVVGEPAGVGENSAAITPSRPKVRRWHSCLLKTGSSIPIATRSYQRSLNVRHALHRHILVPHGALARPRRPGAGADRL